MHTVHSRRIARRSGTSLIVAAVALAAIHAPALRPVSAAAAQATAKAKDPSPTWYVALMAGLMVVGVVLVLLRFVF